MTARARKWRKVLCLENFSKHCESRGWGCVYIVGAVAGGPLKVGVTGSLWARIGQLQAASHEELRLFGGVTARDHGAAWDFEREMHTRLRSSRIRGEWFNIDIATVEQEMTAAMRTHPNVRWMLATAKRLQALGEFEPDHDPASYLLSGYGDW